MNKEDLILEGIKKILDILENPRRELINEKNPNPNKNFNEATDKQIFFLKKAGIKIKEGLTKTEAFQLIKEIKEKEKKEDKILNKITKEEEQEEMDY